MTTSRQRVEAVLNGASADRPPICFWTHFDVDEDPDRLARESVRFFVNDHDLDVVKIMPDLGHPFGLGSVNGRDDWAKVAESDGDAHWADRYRRCASQLLVAMPDDRPVVATFFSPMATAAHLAPGLSRAISDLERWPDEVGNALASLGRHIANVAQDLIDLGIDGVFLGLQGCGHGEIDDDLYHSLVLPAEAAVLQGVPDAMLRIAHLHTDHPERWDSFGELGANLVSFSDRGRGVSLSEIRDRTGAAVMGGWDERGAVETGTAADVIEEGCRSLDDTGGLSHLLAPGCSLMELHPPLLDAARSTPQAWAARASGDEPITPS